MNKYTPSNIMVDTERGPLEVKIGELFSGVRVNALPTSGSIKIKLFANVGVSYITLTWKNDLPKNLTKVTGGAWERTYKDCEWLNVGDDKHYPWYILVSGGSDYHGYYISYPHPLGTCTTPGEALEALLKVREELNK